MCEARGPNPPPKKKKKKKKKKDVGPEFKSQYCKKIEKKKSEISLDSACFLPGAGAPHSLCT
jgi:hypothetical protein